ncbi:MAG: sulfatase-like hydrolase/transferase [Bdellovibrionales bacterium]|nr:sulfatase-like hydrolase/transferase [Bdellovibrionales bacterium]
MRRVVWPALILPALLWINGCEFNRDRKPSILVIAVEGLAFETLSCDSEQGEPEVGLRAFCEEAVRFSHAYTPSTLSQASMSSLLTGLYPVDHGVRHNGNDFLSARFKTLGETALGKRYHTLFVSGGPPIWRKSGLAQGFEIFEDQVDITPGMYYRRAEDVFKIATNWIEHDTGGQPFLAVLFLADLQFPNVPTKTDEGEVREKSEAAQVEEVSESIGTLVRWLKQKRLWNSTNIVLVGLNSLSRSETDTEPPPLSLRSDSTQVALFIKPARKERDNVIQWGVDRNVSLVDVGLTMFEWLGAEVPRSSLAEVQPQSLSSVLVKSEPKWEEDRLILSETAWPDWLEGGGVRWAVRQNQFLYIHDTRPLIFNTRTDRMESLRLKPSDPLWNSLNGDVLDLFRHAQTQPFKGMTPHWPEQLEVARELWRDGTMTRKPKGAEAWSKWYLRQALSTRDWKSVKQLSQALGEPVGSYVAAKQLGENLPMPRNPCVRLVLSTKGDKKSQQSDCADEKVLALHAWQIAKSDDDRQSAQDRFTRLYVQTWMDQDIGRMNYLTDLRWDVFRELPEGPQLADYLLTLKEFEPFARKMSGLLNAKDARFQ